MEELTDIKQVIRNSVSIKFNIKSFTCDECDEVNSCVYAFDPYNIYNDCLKYK